MEEDKDSDFETHNNDAERKKIIIGYRQVGL